MIDKIIDSIKFNYEVVILFGSYVRQDYSTNSDIDVLVVTEDKISNFNYQGINYSIYNNHQLLKQAENGSLFILHLIKEGKIIAGNDFFLNILNVNLKLKSSYLQYRMEILETATILDLNEAEFTKHSKQYCNLILYLYRSYIYATLYDYDKNKMTFSIFNALKIINFPYSDKYSKLKYNSNTYRDFISFKEHFEYLVNKKFENKYKDNSQLFNNTSTKLCKALWLHFLNSSKFDY